MGVFHFTSRSISLGFCYFCFRECFRIQQMATFTPELDTYERKDGTQAIMIRITVDRKHKRVSIKKSIPAKHWNEQKREVRKTYPQAAQVNALIKSKIVELEEIYLRSQANRNHKTAKNLQQAVTRKYSGDSFLEYMERRIKNLPAANTRRSQSAILSKLRNYSGGELSFGEITTEYLAEYRNYLTHVVKNRPNTIHSDFHRIKAAYDDAVEDGICSFEGVHPFTRLKLTTTKSRRVKLKEEHIAILEGYKANPELAQFHALNAFLFSYYMQGIRVGDLMMMEWHHVEGNYLRYQAGKTKKTRPRLLISKAKAILDIYRTTPNPSGYIFPFLKGKRREKHTDDEWAKILDSANAFIRKKLEVIAKQLGLPKFSMHVARHSFADIARKKTGNIYLVSDALDHGNVRVTENYFSAAEAEENDEFVKSILGE